MQINNGAPKLLDYLQGVQAKVIVTVRDPRDVVVSGYFYHRTTKEPWVLQPRPEYRRKSYQEVCSAISHLFKFLRNQVS